jgi:hypothetical protein
LADDLLSLREAAARSGLSASHLRAPRSDRPAEGAEAGARLVHHGCRRRRVHGRRGAPRERPAQAPQEPLDNRNRMRLRCAGAFVVPTYHPAALRWGAARRAAVVADLRTAAALLASAALDPLRHDELTLIRRGSGINLRPWKASRSRSCRSSASWCYCWSSPGSSCGAASLNGPRVLPTPGSEIAG